MRKKNVNFEINTKRNKITNNNRYAHKNTNNYNNKFPSPAILESYEEIYPGFTKELMELTKMEQGQKVQNHENWVKSINATLRFGQFLSFVFSVIVLYVSLNSFNNGSVKTGAIIFITWFVFLLIVNIKSNKLTEKL
ncbi:DUF2335 domain-containing protein [Candidatus Bandiella numerosa]|jgi:uncharacterized membrane protein|uniref:DUF2335 domain-containing protein n=1 Tax=Candidatus Bandiella numerosa TaxID=2570586 RepID=UPI00249F77B9|nr:DUF2335 domain-containing protein [Candidatus Bandiella numerosa]WHA04311.1 DUF2335 domain-containing protein [Candidatus Bandiella numerosa]